MVIDQHCIPVSSHSHHALPTHTNILLHPPRTFTILWNTEELEILLIESNKQDSKHNNPFQSTTIMSVPQFVKRRYSTMFMGSPPWSYENTDDGQFPMLTSFDVPTSAAVPYKELHARAGYPPSRRRTPSPLKMPADSDQVREDTARGLDELKPEDTVPALFSSPKYAVFEGDRGETVKKCLQASGECSPPPPELVFDDGSEVDIVTNHYNMPDTPETEAPPSSEGVDDQYRTLRCPQCQALLKWTQLDNSNHIELRLQRCPLSCSEKQPKNTSGLFSETEVPVQVNRGAW